MILDTLANSGRYHGVHDGFRRAFEFLSRTDPKTLAPGRIPIEGDRLFAIVTKEPGRGRREARLECHARYIDVQYIVSGVDMMGWKPVSACRRPAGPLDAEKDIRYFEDDPEAWIAVHAGAFAVFFPEDAHLPRLSAAEIHKVVVKVAVGGTS
ncbi:MAG: YhcH/YjgK/YiaL family protein [Gemmatimonadota bacterium]